MRVLANPLPAIAREREKKNMNEVEERLRVEALSQSVRVSLALGGHETTDQMVERAEAFRMFLTAAN